MQKDEIIELEFKNGIYQGQSVKNKQKQGMGVYIWKNGDAYYGEWKQDEIDGFGILFIAPKTQIIGHFKQSKMDGKCILSTSKGTYYGEWIKGQPNENITAKLQNQEIIVQYQQGVPTNLKKKLTSKIQMPILNNKIIDQKGIQQLELKNGTYYGVTLKSKLNQMLPKGLGIFTTFNNQFICGQFKDNIFNNGDQNKKQAAEIFQGQLNNGEQHDKGINLLQKDTLQLIKELSKQGILVDVYENGTFKDCSQEIILPYNKQENPILVRQPINKNEIKQFEDQIINYINKSHHSSTTASPDMRQEQIKLTRNYFSNSPMTSYEQISEALFGTKKQEEQQQISKLKQIQQQKNNQFLKYYKDQCQQIESDSKIQHITNQIKQPNITHRKSKTHFIESSNNKEDINGQENNNFKSPFKILDLKYLQQLQNEQQSKKTFQKSNNIQSESSFGFKTELKTKIKQNFDPEKSLQAFQQMKTHNSPNFLQNQFNSKTERIKKHNLQQSNLKIQKNSNKKKNNFDDNVIQIKNNKIEDSNKSQSFTENKFQTYHPQNNEFSKMRESKITPNQEKHNKKIDHQLDQKEQLKTNQSKRLSSSQQDLNTFKYEINSNQQKGFQRRQKPNINDNNDSETLKEKDSPNFEQSKITNNQQSLFSNDIQSLENIQQNEKPSNTIKSYNIDNFQQQIDFFKCKKEAVQQKDFDDFFQDYSQNQFQRQVRRTKSSKLPTLKNQLFNQSIQNNESQVNHSFHQFQEQFKQKVENDFNNNSKSEHYQGQFKQKQNNQEILIQENEISYNLGIQKKSQSSMSQEIQNITKKQENNQYQSQSKAKESKTKNNFRKKTSKSQHSSFIHNEKQGIQFQNDKSSKNNQITLTQDYNNTKQDIQDIKQQLESQKQILASLQNKIQQSQSIKQAESKIINVTNHTKSKSEQINFIPDLCNSPITKIIITKGQFPAFSIIKPIIPIRL